MYFDGKRKKKEHYSFFFTQSFFFLPPQTKNTEEKKGTMNANAASVGLYTKTENGDVALTAAGAGHSMKIAGDRGAPLAAMSQHCKSPCVFLFVGFFFLHHVMNWLVFLESSDWATRRSSHPQGNHCEGQRQEEEHGDGR
jgi:hypothetical protein